MDVKETTVMDVKETTEVEVKETTEVEVKETTEVDVKETTEVEVKETTEVEVKEATEVEVEKAVVRRYRLRVMFQGTRSSPRTRSRRRGGGRSNTGSMIHMPGWRPCQREACCLPDDRSKACSGCGRKQKHS